MNDGRSKWFIDRRLLIYLVMILITGIFVSIFFTTQLKSSSKLQCRDLNRVNIPKGDPEYYPSLDGNHDNIACER